MTGKQTDSELAFHCMENEILAAQTSIQDESLALSTSTTVATDQNILVFIREDENLAEQDYRYALAFEPRRSGRA